MEDDDYSAYAPSRRLEDLDIAGMIRDLLAPANDDGAPGDDG